MTREVPPQSVTGEGLAYVGGNPWITTRDDDASYVTHLGASSLSATWRDLGAGVPLTFVIRAKTPEPPAPLSWIVAWNFDTGLGSDDLEFYPQPDWTDHVVPSTLTSPAGGGPFTLNLALQDSGTNTQYYVTYVAILAGNVVPPVRQRPREDGLGASSARRHWPPPRSAQYGFRRGGGGYA